MKKRLKIFVAGPISAKKETDLFENIRKGQYVSRKVLDSGNSPFCPFIDFLLLLQDGPPVDMEMLYEYSLDWLRVSDAMLVLPGYETSTGTMGEVAEGNRIGIPMEYLIDYRITETAIKSLEKRVKLLAIQ